MGEGQTMRYRFFFFLEGTRGNNNEKERKRKGGAKWGEGKVIVNWKMYFTGAFE